MVSLSLLVSYSQLLSCVLSCRLPLSLLDLAILNSALLEVQPSASHRVVQQMSIGSKINMGTASTSPFRNRPLAVPLLHRFT